MPYKLIHTHLPLPKNPNGCERMIEEKFKQKRDFVIPRYRYSMSHEFVHKIAQKIDIELNQKRYSR